MADDIKYTPKAEEGKQCKDCKFFEAEKNECFGHQVLPQGGCNKFVVKG